MKNNKSTLVVVVLTLLFVGDNACADGLPSDKNEKPQAISSLVSQTLEQAQKLVQKLELELKQAQISTEEKASARINLCHTKPPPEWCSPASQNLEPAQKQEQKNSKEKAEDRINLCHTNPPPEWCK